MLFVGIGFNGKSMIRGAVSNNDIAPSLIEYETHN